MINPAKFYLLIMLFILIFYSILVSSCISTEVNQELSIDLRLWRNPMLIPLSTVSPPQLDSLLSCVAPPELYKRKIINGQIINHRTLWMLKLANQIYKGKGNPFQITQGSYTNELSDSFDTHAGGGGIDISIRTRNDYNQILTIVEANELVLALRHAGFAAWLRLPNDLDPPVALHIHAVAVGDRELSEAAAQQLVGPEGYFRGFDGIPPQFGGSKHDRHGGPIICDWMIDMGFKDLRQ